jgi:uncharacterized protein (TIGR02996 family)
MNEDEIFIRAIVDAPGDDLPRLVYADWLDDRDDPRGAYLRAEHEAVETGDIERLRKLAVGLDPVWVARVSLPPVGVCIEDAEITDHGPLLTAADIDAAERRHSVTFAPDYRAFLLNYNGGLVRLVWGTVDGETIYADFELRLYPLLADSESEGRPTLDREIASFREWVNNPRSYHSGIRNSVVADFFLRYTQIGHTDGHLVLLAAREQGVGGVNLFASINMLPDSLSGYLRDVGQWPAMPSFTEFLAWFLWPPAPPPPITPVNDGIPF